MITLTLPLPGNKANARAHWRAVLADKKAYWRACDSTPNPRPPREPLSRVLLAFHVVHGGSLMDWGNLAARMKHLEDWMVNAGYIADDSPKVIVENPRLTQETHKAAHLRKVVVTITPLDPAPHADVDLFAEVAS